METQRLAPASEVAAPGAGPAPDAYGEVHDPELLRIATVELGAVVAFLDDLAESSAESPDAPIERAAGVQMAKTVVLGRVNLVRRRLTQLPPASRPTPLDSASRCTRRSPSRLRPRSESRRRKCGCHRGHAANAHVHLETDIIVLVRDGQTVTLWWEAAGEVHKLEQRPGQHLHIQRGVPRAAVSRTTRPVIATEFRSSARFDADNHRLPRPDPGVAQLRRSSLRALA